MAVRMVYMTEGMWHKINTVTIVINSFVMVDDSCLLIVLRELAHFASEFLSSIDTKTLRTDIAINGRKSSNSALSVNAKPDKNIQFWDK